MALVAEQPNVFQRRSCLYGPDRRLAADNLKEILQRSHIFQDGQYNLQPHRKDDFFKTTAATEFRNSFSNSKSSWNPKKIYNDQLITHYQLGHDNEELEKSPTAYKVSVTQGDFDRKKSVRPFVHHEDRRVHWSDMAPQYRGSSSFPEDSSEYNIAFTNKQSLLLPSTSRPQYPKINGRKLKPVYIETKPLKKVHVILGSDDTRYRSETESAYEERSNAALANAVNEGRDLLKTMKDTERQSNVIRKGDYNYNERGETYETTFSADYGRGHIEDSFPYHRSEDSDGEDDEDPEQIKKLTLPNLFQDMLRNNPSSKEYREGKKDHTSAHFKLGNETEVPESVYANDFQPGMQHKPFIQPPPKDSEVLQRDYDKVSGTTTNSAEHGRHTHNMLNLLDPDRIFAARLNMLRRHGNNVMLSYDHEKHKDDRAKSLSHYDYRKPPEYFRAMKPRTAPVGRYDILATDDALPYAVPRMKPFTENMTNFTVNDKLKTARETLGRVRHRDSLSTHFSLGSTGPEYVSVAQTAFLGDQKNDGHIPAAGRVETEPGFDFSHLRISDNTNDLKPLRPTGGSGPTFSIHSASVMKNDYRPINEMGFTDAQQMILEQNERLEQKPVANTHYFFTDNSGNDNMKSTTNSDFISPEFR